MRSKGPNVGIDLRDIYARHHAQQVGNIVGARTANVFLRDYENGRGGLRNFLFFF